jgi:predicted transcriptional regulator
MTSAYRNSQLIEIIEKNPGIKFRELMRVSGMKNGVLSHYLSRLEKSGNVQVHRGTRQTRFFPLKFGNEESKIISAIRTATPRDIILSLILNENGLEFNEIVTHVKKSPSTVSLYLSKLIEDNIVGVKLVNRKKHYYIKDKIIIDKLIEDYHPNLFEKATTGLEEIINSL